jgi:hypothetical protein
MIIEIIELKIVPTVQEVSTVGVQKKESPTVILKS